jgi:uncharacterized membrane-anchored protein YhcB (DUF1043 family)
MIYLGIAIGLIIGLPIGGLILAFMIETHKEHESDFDSRL